MQLIATLSALLATTLAAPACSLAPRQDSGCQLTGIVGTIPPQTRAARLAVQNNIPSAEACRALCFEPENAACTAFAYRSSGSGGCTLFNTTISSSIIPRETAETFYVLPAGVRGGTPHNNPAWYAVDNSKTRGNYAGCREFCLMDDDCRGFGFKDGGNCRLFSVSLAGRVSPNEAFPYIHYQSDCVLAAAPNDDF